MARITVDWGGTVAALDVSSGSGVVVSHGQTPSDSAELKIVEVRRSALPWRISLACEPGGRVSVMPFRDGERGPEDLGKPSAEGPAAWSLQLSEPDPITQAIGLVATLVAALYAPVSLWRRVRRIGAAADLRRALRRHARGRHR